MKTTHIITRLIIGGAQENTLLTCEDQHRDYGDDVTLIAGPGLGPEGSLIERAERAGFRLEIVPELRRNIYPVKDWRSYRTLVRLLRDIRPDVVHTHSTKAGVMGRAAAAKLHLPAVHTVHGPSFYPGQSPALSRFYIAAEKWAAKRCRKMISVADAMTDQYVAAGVAPREKFVTIYSGMEVEPFLNPPRPRDEVRCELGFEPHHVVVGKVARLFKLKGHEYVIRAAAQAAANRPEVRFLMVGDGVLRERFEDEIARLGMTDRFVFTGLAPPERVPELIAAMDVVVHASLREGLARVLPQALIAGKPVISYDVDGAREVVIPGETGFLLPAKSVEEMSAAIETLAGDASLRERMGAEGRKRFTQQFRHETMTRRVREVYEDVLAEV